MRNTFTYSNQFFNLKNLLSYSKKFTYSSILLSNKIEDKYSQYQTVVCLGSRKTLSSEKNSFSKLRNFHNKYKDWMFGFCENCCNFLVEIRNWACMSMGKD